MQVRALKTFNSRDYGLIRTGVVITVSERYGRQIVQKGFAEVHEAESREPDNVGDPGPDDNRDLGQAPKRKEPEGNAEGSDGDDSHDPETEVATSSERSQDDGSTESSVEVPQTAGRRQLLSSRQVARPSRKKTSTTSKAKRS